METELGAWALDEACLVTGRQFENMLHEGKDPFASALPAKERTSSLKGRVTKKVKIKADGTW